MKSRGLLLLGALLLIGAAEPPKKPVPLDPQEAARQGRALAAEILAQQPATDSKTTGVMKIRLADGKRLEIPVEFRISLTPSNWQSSYATINSRDCAGLFIAEHSRGEPARYKAGNLNSQPADGNPLVPIRSEDLMSPFACSDFWLADLALDFLNWPEQHLLKNEMRNSRPCRVLESINPHPAPGAYRRVVSWIDDESDGIVHADAYDARNKRLKEFAPKGFKKVNGVWEVEEMEMDNDQTGSRTLIQFNLEGK
jgi:hypothetical protein